MISKPLVRPSILICEEKINLTYALNWKRPVIHKKSNSQQHTYCRSFSLHDSDQQTEAEQLSALWVPKLHTIAELSAEFLKVETKIPKHFFKTLQQEMRHCFPSTTLKTQSQQRLPRGVPTGPAKTVETPGQPTSRDTQGILTVFLWGQRTKPLLIGRVLWVAYLCRKTPRKASHPIIVLYHSLLLSFMKQADFGQFSVWHLKVSLIQSWFRSSLFCYLIFKPTKTFNRYFLLLITQSQLYWIGTLSVLGQTKQLTSKTVLNAIELMLKNKVHIFFTCLC